MSHQHSDAVTFNVLKVKTWCIFFGGWKIFLQSIKQLLIIGIRSKLLHLASQMLDLVEQLIGQDDDRRPPSLIKIHGNLHAVQTGAGEFVLLVMLHLADDVG